MPSFSQTFSATGTWTAPTDVTAVKVECWGGGGAGGGASVNNNGGGGGAGGQYVIKTAYTVVPGATYTVTVAATKTGTTGTAGAGNDSWFDSTSGVIAKGGAGGTANNGAGGTGSTTGGIGDTVNAGGNGVAGSASNSGAGGGGAGTGGAGGNGSGTTAGTGTATGGGNGGAGRASGTNLAGLAGSTMGGGGGGAFRTTTTSRAGGNGAAGQVILTWTSNVPATGSQLNVRVKPRLPILNRDHELVRGLVLDFPFYEGGGTVIHDTVQGLIGNFGSTKPSWTTTIHGPAITFTNNTNQSIAVNDYGLVENIPYMTVESLVLVPTLNTAALITKNMNSVNGPQWQVRSDAGTNSWAWAGGWSNNPGWGSTNGSYVTNVWTHLIVSIGALTDISATPQFLINGSDQNSYAFSVAPTGSYDPDAPTLWIGNGDPTLAGNGAFSGTVSYVRVWNRFLTRKEKLALYRDPFQIYKQPNMYQSLNSIAAANRIQRYGFANFQDPAIF